MPSAGTMTIAQTDTAVVSFTNAAGQPTAPAAPPVWSIDNPAIAVPTPAADGMSCVFSNAVPPLDGTANITCVAQGDPTPGVDVITLTGTLTVTGGEISVGQMTWQPPTP